MGWTLISFSETKVSFPPHPPEYILGIVENESGQKKITQIEREHLPSLTIGMRGELKETTNLGDIILQFVPENSSKKREQQVEVALVTGSLRGIGRAIALKLAHDGMIVIVNNSSTTEEGTKLAEEIQSLGQSSWYLPADISDPHQVQEMVTKIIEKYGRINILVNNAGITRDKKLENMDLSDWNKVISVNLTGMFNCTKEVIKHMQNGERGRIINISSVVGEMGNIGQSNYSASKGGIIAFTKTVAKEYASKGILVNAVAPGFIKTQMVESIPSGILKSVVGQIPLGRLGQAEEVAEVVSFLASEKASYITGQVINVNGGLLM